MKLSTLCLAILALSSTCACQGADHADAPPPPPTLGRWTDAFEESAIVIADEIAIEGPPALRAHFALPQDPALISIVTRATDRGLLQVATLKEETGELSAQLDNWTIVATRRLEVLERPGETTVRIVARGGAVWRPVGPGAEARTRRAPELVLVGELTP
jgi:hypothetical protein